MIEKKPELQVTIPLSVVKEWLKCARSGLDPKVSYNGDSLVMLREAYDIRENFFKAIECSIIGWIGDK